MDANKLLGKKNYILGTIDNYTFSNFQNLTELQVVYSLKEIVIRPDALEPLENLQTLKIFRSDVDFKNPTSDENTTVREILHHFETLDLTDSTVTYLSRDILYPFKNLKVLRIINTDIRHITTDVFADLDNIETFFVKTTNIEPFDPSLILKMKSLKHLALHDIYTKSKIDHSIFKNLPNLEIIFFDLLAYKDLDFDSFVKLKTVQYAIHENTQEFQYIFKENKWLYDEALEKLYALGAKNITIESQIFEGKRHFPQ